MIKTYFKKNACPSHQRGYTLVETLVYLAIFIIMSLIIVSLILSVLESNKYVKPSSSLSRSAVSVLEVMSKEIRGARSIDITNSIFATTTGSLQLNSVDSNGNQRLVKFYLASASISIMENGVFFGPLSTADVVVTGLIFNLATSTADSLLKIELDLTAGNGKYQKTEKFYNSVKLRTDN